jgi:preprotein translocase subunit SecA
VLGKRLDEAHDLVNQMPGLPVSLIGGIQRIEQQCREDREHIWEAGGLHIVGTERHEARRIDNQLRGRAARQGDPGSSRFFLSLEDELMIRFGGDRIKGLMDRLNLPDDEPISANILSNAIEQAQSRFESYYFDIRKNLIEYDEAVNRQREIVYAERRSILEGDGGGLDAMVRTFFADTFRSLIARYGDGESYSAWAMGEVQSALEDFSDLESGQVNTLGVLRRTQALFPRLTPEQLHELQSIEAEGDLAEALNNLILDGVEVDHHIRMLIGQIVNIMPLWPPLPDVARTGTRGQEPFTQAVRSMFDRYAASLPPDQQQAIWEPLANGLSRAFHEVALRAGRGDNPQEIAAGFMQAVNEAMLEASHALLADLDAEALLEALLAQVDRLLSLWRDDPSVGIGTEQMVEFERALMLAVIDQEWRQYLTAVDDLRQGIGLEAFGQRDPKVEFKRRVFDMFDTLRDDVREGIARNFFTQLPRHRQTIEAQRREEEQLDRLSTSGYRAERTKGGQVTLRREMWNVGRNDPCPCGSGKKFKDCHWKQLRQQQHTVSVDEVRRTAGAKKRRRR